MRMDLIQPFIGSLDAVLAEMMKTAPRIVDLTMEEEGYRRKGLAASVSFKGEIQGRVILDMDPQAAAQVASYLAGDEVDSSQPIVREAVCELANMVIGNAVTQLNDSLDTMTSIASIPGVQSTLDFGGSSFGPNNQSMNIQTPYGSYNQEILPTGITTQ